MWQQQYSNPQSLSSQTNTQSFCQTGQMIDLCCVYLSVRYSLKPQISRLFRGRRSLTFRELQSVYSLWNENMKNNIQGFHFLGAIKIVTTMIHSNLCLNLQIPPCPQKFLATRLSMIIATKSWLETLDHINSNWVSSVNS